MYKKALIISRELNSPLGGRGVMHLALGMTAFWLGDVQENAAEFEKAQSIFREVGDRASEGWLMSWRVGFDLLLGDLERVEERAKRSLELAEESASWENRGFAFGSIGQVRMYQDRFGEARESLEESRQLMKKTGGGGWESVSLAELEVEDGNALSAAALAREAQDELRSVNSPHGALSATAILARALAESGHTDEAERELLAAAREAPGLQGVWSRLRIALHLAYAERALGRGEDARRRIENHQATAEEVGAVPWQMQAGILLATLDLREGDAASARAALKAIENDARARGLAWLARKASEAAGPSS
jgi:tetratricopeptide (TPR) repeat protein